MNPIKQIYHGVILSPMAIFLMKGRTFKLFVLYIIFAGCILGAVAFGLLEYKEDIKKIVLTYLFPGSWHETISWAFQFMFSSQAKTVVINASISGAMILVSTLLFPLKEKISATLEEDQKLITEPIDEFGLFKQGFEEFKLIILYATVQMSIFWIGYRPEPAFKQTATVLSYGFLFFSFAIDFISPVGQRHKCSYAMIMKTLLKHPFLSLSFGALFSMPTVLLGDYLETETLLNTVLLLFIPNVLLIAWATLGGTTIGAALLPLFKKATKPRFMVALLSWLLMLSLLTANLFVFRKLVLVIHHKSQILKSEYSIVPGSFGVDSSTFTALLAGNLEAKIHFTVRIRNPTEFDMELEKNRLIVKHNDDILAKLRLSPVAVAAGQTVTQKMRMSTKLDVKFIKQYLNEDNIEKLLDDWRIILYVEIMENVELPIFLL